MNPFKIERWSLLAGLRFLFAMIVVCTHLGNCFSPGNRIVQWVSSFGSFEAILGFLLVSGYSVGSSCLKESEGFLKRRFLRIYPVYLFSIVFALGVDHWPLAQSLPSPKYTILNLFFLNQIFTTSSLVGPAWSLALEVWMYCLCPFLLVAQPRLLRVLCLGSFVCYAVYTLGRSAFHLPYYSGVGYGGNLLFLSFAWICGLRLADTRGDRAQALRDTTVYFALHILIQLSVAAVSQYRHHHSFLPSWHDFIAGIQHAITLLIALLVFHNIGNGVAIGARSVALRFLGDISYPVYLLHFSWFALLVSFHVSNPAVLTCSVLFFSSIVYLILDRYSQKRHLKLSPAIT